ncbi:MAG: peptide chain release factor 2 [bacterium]|nr:peptide chain release factor 2 [bacterium]MDE0353378.1 peptide chain release factor 2 [bacterium]
MDRTDPRPLIDDLRARLSDARRFLDVDSKLADLVELRAQVSLPDLWDDPDRATRLTRRLGRFERLVNRVEAMENDLDDADILVDLAREEGDAATLDEVARDLDATERRIAVLEEESLYFGEYDDHAAILSVHAGAGGVDAQDWAEMMVRMYVRYLTELGFEHEIDDLQSGEEAGIKSATLTAEGEHAYAVLEAERGVHRLVRISPFDSNSRRHTSFAGVDVVPLVEDAAVEISPDDLRIDTYRSQGAGGQHVNTTDSAVRLTHLPTGIVVACQAERSQLQNRARAMALLRAKLAELARVRQQEELDQIRGEQTEAAWGRQIRSYVLQPYQQVKDLRTGLEVGNVQGVLDGGLGRLTESYLHWRRANRERQDRREAGVRASS